MRVQQMQAASCGHASKAGPPRMQACGLWRRRGQPGMRMDPCGEQLTRRWEEQGGVAMEAGAGAAAAAAHGKQRSSPARGAQQRRWRRNRGGGGSGEGVRFSSRGGVGGVRREGGGRGR
ncbi:unnamed protein product [Urochloa humidicola]